MKRIQANFKKGVIMIKAILPILIVMAVSFAGCAKNTSNENTPPVNQMYAPGDNNTTNNPAPDFTLTSTSDKTIKLSDYKGKIIIVDFWATWCPPCRRGIPDLIEIQKQYGKDVVVIGISMDTDSKSDVVPFVQQMGINYPVAYATSGVVQSYGGVESIPSSFVIDKNGNIVDTHIGLVPKSDFTSLIDKLLRKS
jgi:cytochrome c biogenesis protein CcmG/thiol:disulfide interchange protein DsbE